MMEKFSDKFKKIISSIKLVTDHPLTIFALYATTFFIYRDFGVRMILGYSLLSILVGLILLDKFYSKRFSKLSNVKLAYAFYTLIIFLNYIRPGSNHDNANTVYILVMILSALTILFSKINYGEIRTSMKLFAVTSMLFATFILFFQVFQKLYWTMIYPLLSETAAVYAKKYFFKGYSVSLGGFTYTDYILIFGFISILSYLLYNRIDKTKRVVLSVVLALIFFTLVLVGRRGEVVAFILSLGVFFIASGGEGRRLKRAGYLLAFLLVLVVILIALLPILDNVKFLHRYTMTIKALFFGGEVKGGVASGRFELYTAAWNLFVENPFFGIGWGNFAKHATDVMGYSPTITMDVHNIVIQLLAETGIIGAVLILSPIVYLNISVFKQCSRLWSRKLQGNVDSLQLTASTVSLLFQTFILTVAFVDPSNYKTVYWAFYFVSIYLHLCALELEGKNSSSFLEFVHGKVNSGKEIKEMTNDKLS